MNYLQAEYLKNKRTFTKKMIVLAPVITALMNILAPLWFQVNSYNWWYILLYPGFLTLICALLEQRDNSKLNYRAVFTLPVDLKKAWSAKIGIAGFYVALGNLLFLALNLLGGYMMLAIYKIPLTIGVLQAISGTLCIVIASLWEVPLSLWLSKKVGIFLTIVLNVGVGSVLGVLTATSNFWILCPYSWVPHLMISVLKIMPNGVPAAVQNAPLSFEEIGGTLLLSMIAFILLSLITAKGFEKEVK